MSIRLAPYSDFFGQPVSILARLILLVSLLSMIWVFQDPLWTMSFRSNQYPDPLRLAIHVNHLEGQKTPLRDDLREINSLNKYIGMRPLLESDFSEFQWLPLALGIFVLLVLRIVVFGRLRDLVDVTVLYIYFGLYNAYNFYMRLYSYGHNLDPTAPITVEPFTPPIYGSVKVANFWVESYPGGASYALTAFGALMVLALVTALIRARKKPAAANANPSRDSSGVAQLTLGIAVTLGVLCSTPGWAAEVHVGGSSGFRTLSSAYAAAQPGDSLVIHPGALPERLTVEKSISIIGLPGASIDGDGTGCVLLITADHVTVKGLVIRGSGRDMMSSDSGVKVLGSHAVIQCNSFEGNLFGVYLGQGESSLVEDNVIVGPAELGMGSRGAGIHLYDSNNNVVRGNDISFVRDGVYFDHADNNLVEDNELHQLRYGVHYMYCGPNEFYRNIFRDSVAGVAIMYTDNVVFSDNLIINNRNGYNAFGLLFQACRNCVAERNVIINNTSGIFLEGARNNVLRNNLIAYNDVGAIIYGSSSDNIFQSNDFVSNLTTLNTVGRTTVDWGSGGGNFFDNYLGYDLDSDGVGDIPHKLQDAFEALTGNNPLLRLYLSSPAADALRLAETAFPMLPVSTQIEERPAMRPVSGVDARRMHTSAGTNSRTATWSILALVGVVALLFWRAGR